jgi:hypothetical protein
MDWIPRRSAHGSPRTDYPRFSHPKRRAAGRRRHDAGARRRPGVASSPRKPARARKYLCGDSRHRRLFRRSSTPRRIACLRLLGVSTSTLAGVDRRLKNWGKMPGLLRIRRLAPGQSLKCLANLPGARLDGIRASAGDAGTWLILGFLLVRLLPAFRARSRPGPQKMEAARRFGRSSFDAEAF